jgi:hypothetical protein
MQENGPISWPTSRAGDGRFQKGIPMAESTTVKDEARRLVEELPEEASWEDLMYRIYVRQTIEAGLRDADAGRTTPVEEVRRRFGLPA